ncbi:MAG: glycine cleavage system aminomethyltransferase GcvT [Candidatus Hydrogenedentota bacterium]|nr:MAG: glycine cleavage system aminomethyltransferase GcvT [Candidatus Hydrogenedentota bacterium]
MVETSSLKETVLAPIHEEEGARMGPFAGYRMPLTYAGTLAEHRAVREKAGIFDVSHMGQALIRNPSVDRVLSRPLTSIPVGTGRYTLILNADGGIVDDTFVYRLEESLWHIVVNASRKETDWKVLGEIEVLEDVAMIAIQGPRVVPLLGEMCARRRFVRETEVAGVNVRLLVRTGYTGEDGYEAIVEKERAAELWRVLRRKEMEPCGLAARDLLRIEAALPLYGADIDETTRPHEVGLEFAVREPDRKGFVARDILSNPPPRRFRRCGIVGSAGPIPRRGATILDAGGEDVGVVTSGTFSPVLQAPIALGRIASSKQPAGVVIRGRKYSVKEAPLPFYRRERNDG